jgi:hypothetical protein
MSFPFVETSTLLYGGDKLSNPGEQTGICLNG